MAKQKVGKPGMIVIEDLIAKFGSRQALWQYLFYYKDGKLYWKNPRAPRVRHGDLAGQFNARYWSCNVCSKRVYIHRIIYEMYNGDTELEVDHIDRNTDNNNIENLREATRLLNVLNVGIRKDNTTGFRGVSFSKSRNAFVAQASKDGKRILLGAFNTAEEASICYEANFKKQYGIGDSNEDT